MADQVLDESPKRTMIASLRTMARFKSELEEMEQKQDLLVRNFLDRQNFK